MENAKNIQRTEVAPGQGNQARRDATKRRSHLTREIIETIALTLLIYLAVHLTIQPYYVDGPSMQPGLHTGELVVTNVVTYRFTDPQRGDVVVLHPPSDPGEQYIKRVIAVPGDTITITATSVSVNGHRLSEPYIAPLPASGLENPSVVPTLKLDKDQYWVMGDNRLNSTDSRFFGVVPKNNIIGKAELVAWPLGSAHWLPDYSRVYAGGR